ncbi:MAG: acyl-CoA synthase [Cypionkella sp.]|uniref:AMP-binding protein n=1 Tax=Cypionkella sp. TaxID=2811411 RepID=UPI002601A040|nr:AMP-binding protein [Cypionkella sp.]MDB5659696.1 acyl-CoA synthase [Cypionkella sp.]
MQNDLHLARRAANHQPLTPLDFLDRALTAFPDRLAVVWRDRRWSYAQFGDIVARMAAFLQAQGVRAGDVVSVMLPNRPEMLAAHYAVPLLGAVLNSINTRLDAATVGYILAHSESRLILCDETTVAAATEAAKATGLPCHTLRALEGKDFEAIADKRDAPGHTLRALHGEGGIDLLTGPVPVTDLFAGITDEWQPICLNYTSGTTGHPKGVVYHHRGAYLNALGNVLALGLGRDTVYLWTLPMFHCNGWCHTWAVTAAGGVHVCLDRVDPADIFAVIAAHGVTHMACAPVVLYMLLNHPDRPKRATRRVKVASGGASPSVALIAGLEALGFDFIHLYGLTESYGPVTMCALDPHDAAQPTEVKATRLARQGNRHLTANRVTVVNDSGEEVPWDGVTSGEIALRGNTLMAGYHRDPSATEAAFAGGHFRTGDLAVRHPNGELEIRDRAKDVIISGGENISSLEVENILHQHPGVLFAAVVAAPDPKWGEIPCAFIELKPGHQVTAEDMRSFCRAHLAGFKLPRRFVFGALPRTATGKIQKFLLRKLARDGGES